MKIRYKIIVIAVCAYFGVFFGPVIASNVYCDFIAQEMCTSRITGVSLPPFNMIPLSLPSDNECFFENTEGMMEPCYIETGFFEWPFPSRMHEYEHNINCDEICTDSQDMIIDENKEGWTAEYIEMSPEQQCANSYHLMQDKITHIRQSGFLAVSDYVQEIDNLLEIKKDIQRQDCESTAYQWIHLVTNSEKLSDPPQIVIERTHDNVRKITNDQLVRPEYVVPWKILDYLQQHKIEFTNAPPSNVSQTDEGWTDPTRLCSRLFFTNETQFYASATFHPDPLNITGIFVDLERPTYCQKHFPIPKGFQ